MQHAALLKDSSLHRQAYQRNFNACAAVGKKFYAEECIAQMLVWTVSKIRQMPTNRLADFSCLEIRLDLVVHFCPMQSCISLFCQTRCRHALLRGLCCPELLTASFQVLYKDLPPAGSPTVPGVQRELSDPTLQKSLACSPHSTSPTQSPPGSSLQKQQTVVQPRQRQL